MQENFTWQDVKLLREQLNITQRELAKRLGVWVETISRWENGFSKRISKVYVRMMLEMKKEI